MTVSGGGTPPVWRQAPLGEPLAALPEFTGRAKSVDGIEKTEDRRESEIACSLQSKDQSDRVAEWVAVARRGLIAKSVTADGVVLTYRQDAAVEADLRRLVELEGECCPFLEFAVSADGGDISLGITGPKEARELVETFLRLPTVREHSGVTGP
jgi:hypothetical protein